MTTISLWRRSRRGRPPRRQLSLGGLRVGEGESQTPPDGDGGETLRDDLAMLRAAGAASWNAIWRDASADSPHFGGETEGDFHHGVGGGVGETQADHPRVGETVLEGHSPFGGETLQEGGLGGGETVQDEQVGIHERLDLSQGGDTLPEGHEHPFVGGGETARDGGETALDGAAADAAAEGGGGAGDDETHGYIDEDDEDEGMEEVGGGAPQTMLDGGETARDGGETALDGAAAVRSQPSTDSDDACIAKAAAMGQETDDHALQQQAAPAPAMTPLAEGD